MLGISLGINVDDAAQWWPEGTSYAANFVNDRFVIGGSSKAPASAYSLVRASSKLASDALGNWTIFSSNIPALTNQGISIETADTYYSTNSSLTGASLGVIGSGGALPDGWSIYTGGTSGSATVTAITTFKGLPAIVLDWDLVNSGGSTAYPNFKFIIENSVATDTWTGAVFYDAVSNFGDTSANSQFEIQEHNSGGGYLVRTYINLVADGTRQSVTRTLTSGSAASAYMMLEVQVPAGEALKRTMTIAMPTLTKSSVLSSPMLTTDSGTLARAADTLNLLLPAGTHDLTLNFIGLAPVHADGISGSYSVSPIAGAPQLETIFAVVAS